MKVSIGDKLKQLRLQKGLTQEQLADVFRVSPQAISRWENNTSYPDITLLPGLAIYYNTSVDALLGMDTYLKKDTLCRIHREINEYVVNGQPDKAIARIRDSLKIYPNDSGLVISLCETLAHKKDDPLAAQEAISIAEQILNTGDVSIKAKSTTSANLLFLYLRTRQQEKATALLRSLPHFWESREILMPEVYSGKEYEEALRECIRKVLAFFCRKIEAVKERQQDETPAYIQLGADFTPTASVAEMLTQLKTFIEA